MYINGVDGIEPAKDLLVKKLLKINKDRLKLNILCTHYQSTFSMPQAQTQANSPQAQAQANSPQAGARFAAFHLR